MAYEKYFLDLIKQTGPSEQTRVRVPIDEVGLQVGSDGQLKIAVSAAYIAAATITATELANGAATPIKTINRASVTATDTGATTGIIPDTATHATVTSGGSTKIVTLPTPTPGRMVVIDVGANGFKLQTTAPASISINGGSGASAVSAIAASSTIIAICISATAWKAIFLDADSDVAKVAAAA